MEKNVWKFFINMYVHYNCYFFIIFHWVSDLNLIRVNPSHFESLRKTFWISFAANRLKINPNKSELGMLRIEFPISDMGRFRSNFWRRIQIRNQNQPITSGFWDIRKLILKICACGFWWSVNKNLKSENWHFHF